MTAELEEVLTRLLPEQKNTQERSCYVLSVMAEVANSAPIRIVPASRLEARSGRAYLVRIPDETHASISCHSKRACLKINHQAAVLFLAGLELFSKCGAPALLERRELERRIQRGLEKQSRWENIRYGFLLLRRALFGR